MIKQLTLLSQKNQLLNFLQSLKKITVCAEQAAIRKDRKMTKRKLTFNDDTTVTINPRISIKKLREFQRQKLLPASLLEAFVNADKDPQKMEPYLINSVWIAYLNANPTTNMTQAEFEDKIGLDFALFGEVLTEMVGGTAKADAKMAQGFKRATKK